MGPFCVSEYVSGYRTDPLAGYAVPLTMIMTTRKDETMLSPPTHLPSTIEPGTLTDAQIDQTIQALQAERNDRTDLARAFMVDPKLADAYQTATLDRAPGDEWVQPLGAFDAYPAGWQVWHAGKTWESVLAANVFEPGVSGWRELLPGGQIPEWVQPTGAHDAYQVGDQVIHNGHLWESTSDGNVWEPGAPGTALLWIDLGPIEGGEDLEPDPEEQAD